MKSYTGVVDKLIGVVLIIAFVVALAPIVLVYIGNLSTTGILLAATVSTIVGLMFAFWVIKTMLKQFN